MEGRFVILDFAAAFDRVSHRGLLYKVRFIGVGGQFLFIVSEFLNDRLQREILDSSIIRMTNNMAPNNEEELRDVIY